MEEKIKKIKYRKIAEIELRAAKQGDMVVFFIPKELREKVVHGKEYLLTIFEKEEIT